MIGYGVGWYDGRVPFAEFLDMFHGRNERVSLESLDKTHRLLERVVAGFYRLRPER